MPLFKTIDVVKEYIPIAFSNGDTSIPRMQKAAEDQYLLPVLGADLMATLQAEADGDLETPSDLLKKAWTALAYLMYYKELPFIHTLITDSGIRNVTNEKVQGAYRYQYEDLLQVLENEGLAGLELLFQFLFDNRADDPYTAWAQSAAYQRLNRNLIRTGADFANYFHLLHPHRTFYSLQPIVQEVEDLYLVSSIGKEFLAELKAADEPDDYQTIVIDLLKHAEANFTIHKAISKLSVKVRPEGFTVMLGTGSDRQPQAEASASDKQLAELKTDTARDGNAYLNRAIKYLNDTASDSVLTTWFNSSLYKDPTATVTNINDSLNGILVL